MNFFGYNREKEEKEEEEKGIKIDEVEMKQKIEEEFIIIDKDLSSVSAHS